MRVVDRPAIYPSRCAALPYVGPSRGGRWIDTGSEMLASNKDQHVYLCEAAVADAARLMGFVPRYDLQVAELRVQQLEQRLLDFEVELKEANRFLDAVDVLESKDFTARKRPGRPRKEVEA